MQKSEAIDWRLNKYVTIHGTGKQVVKWHMEMKKSFPQELRC